MLMKAKAVIKEYSLLNADDKVVVGLSGGADSMALLHLLLALGYNVSACHINHQLRGEESDSDQRFVEQICSEWNVPLSVFNVDVNSLKEKHMSTEQVARNARYEIFSGYEGFKIATAHNANDNAETLLINISRGTGLKGLCSIPIKRNNIVRPLLFSTRAEIEKYCLENSIPFVIDSTNLTDDYTRNKIRNNIIPRLVEINPSFIESISRLTENITEENEFIEAKMRELYDNAYNDDGFSLEILKKADKIVVKRLISKIIKDKGITPSALMINSAYQLIKDGQGKINISKNYFIQVKNRKFHIFFEKQSYRNR